MASQSAGAERFVISDLHSNKTARDFGHQIKSLRKKSTYSTDSPEPCCVSPGGTRRRIKKTEPSCSLQVMIADGRCTRSLNHGRKLRLCHWPDKDINFLSFPFQYDFSPTFSSFLLLARLLLSRQPKAASTQGWSRVGEVI
jgi:hypothetical protein